MSGGGSAARAPCITPSHPEAIASIWALSDDGKSLRTQSVCWGAGGCGQPEVQLRGAWRWAFATASDLLITKLFPLHMHTIHLLSNHNSSQLLWCLGTYTRPRCPIVDPHAVGPTGLASILITNDLLGRTRASGASEEVEPLGDFAERAAGGRSRPVRQPDALIGTTGSNMCSRGVAG